MGEKEMKQCQYCKEDMKVDVKVCSHCRKKQKGDSDFKILPVIISFSIIAVLVIVYVLTMRSVERERKKSMFDALSDNGGTKISELVEEYKEKVDDVIGHSDESSTENVWETIEPVEIWEGNTVRMYFNNGNPNVMFEFTGDDIARQIYNCLGMTNSIMKNYNTFSVFIIANNEKKEIGNIIYINGDALSEELPDLWTGFMEKNDIGNGKVTIGDFVSEDIQKADQERLMEAVKSAVQN